MMDTNSRKTVSIVSGAEWIIRGLTLLLRAPSSVVLTGGCGFLMILVAFILGAIVERIPVTQPLASVLPVVATFLAVAVSGFVFAGLLWAVRELDMGHIARPAHLLVGFSAEKRRQLLIVMLPQFVAAIAIVFLFPLLLTAEDIRTLTEASEKLQALQRQGVQPNPAEIQLILENAPLRRALFALCAVFGIALIGGGLMLLAMPQVLFEYRDGSAALRRSLALCRRYPLPIAMFLVLLIVAMGVVVFLVAFLVVILQWLLGPAVASMAAQMIMMIATSLLTAAAAYCAWKQWFAEPEKTVTPSPQAGIEL